MKQNKVFKPNLEFNSYLLQAMVDFIRFACSGVPQIQVWRGYPGMDAHLPPSPSANPHHLVININPDVAVKYFVIEGDVVYFEGRFNGKPQGLAIPIGAIMLVYDRENFNNAMVLNAVAVPVDASTVDMPKPEETRPRPKLSIVKND